jgi:2,4-dienoyl-CoA reductase-like NADH-dependent reductase (Old Yellow Enzyme family)
MRIGLSRQRKRPMPNLDVLFEPYRVNALYLPNRAVMAPMTRSMSPGGVPTAEVAGYYRRRAENGVGLIITEATGVGRPAALNEPDMPHFHGEAALAGWKKVVDEVHAAGGRIAPQLVHVGHKPAFPEIDRELNLAGWAKKLTGVTSITVGSVGLSGDVYESFSGKSAGVAALDGLLARLERGEFDLIAVGRALLQDPAWLEKVRQGCVRLPTLRRPPSPR